MESPELSDTRHLKKFAGLEAELARFDPTAPLAEATAIPSSWYLDPAVFELERQALFATEWQFVGPAATLKSPRDYLTAEVAGEPLVVLRDEAGTLRAFSNVCRHRGGPLAKGSGCGLRALKCAYHGWTYSLDGALVGAPEFEGVRGFSLESVHLPQVGVAQWGPFVFCRLEGGDTSLTQYLGDFAEVFQPEDLAYSHRKVHAVNCNWKVFVDNYLDGGYHVSHVHPGLAGILDYKHYHCELHDRWNVQVTPLRPVERARDAAYVQARRGDIASYYWLFPNLMLNCYGGVLETNLVLPLSLDRIAVVFDYWYERVNAEGTEPLSQASGQISDQIQDEDRDICEAVQRGLASRWYDRGRFSVRRENGGHQFHVLLAQALRKAVDPCQLAQVGR